MGEKDPWLLAVEQRLGKRTTTAAFGGAGAGRDQILPMVGQHLGASFSHDWREQP